MKAIIFDMDGVLVLTGPAHYEAWKQAAARDGIDLDYETFSHTFGRTNPDVIRMIWTEFAGRNVDPAHAMKLADEKERAFRDIVRAQVPLAPGLGELLEHLAVGGFALGIGSSAPRENIDLVLDAAGLRHFFAGVVDGSMVSQGKPAPDVFLMAARLCAVDPAHCVVLEDAPAGIQAARAAGMHALGVATTHPDHELTTAGAHEVIPTLADWRQSPKLLFRSR